MTKFAAGRKKRKGGLIKGQKGKWELTFKDAKIT